MQLKKETINEREVYRFFLLPFSDLYPGCDASAEEERYVYRHNQTSRN